MSTAEAIRQQDVATIGRIGQKVKVTPLKLYALAPRVRDRGTT